MNTHRLLSAARRWNIPRDVAQNAIDRDSQCIYCRLVFGNAEVPGRRKPSWEHIVNDGAIVTASNIALCCVGCNASKGVKRLGDWLQSDYCVRMGISVSTIARVAAHAIQAEAFRGAI